MTTLQNPQHATNTALPLPEIHATPLAWMPLEGVAQSFATFAGTVFTQAAYMATSMAFSALSMEASVLRHDSQTYHCRFHGNILAARAASEQTIQDLQDAASQWIRALYWLERLAVGEPGQMTHSQKEQARIHSQFSEATEQLQRLSLLTFQMQETCVPLYQRTDFLVEEDARSGRRQQEQKEKQER